MSRRHRSGCRSGAREARAVLLSPGLRTRPNRSPARWMHCVLAEDTSAGTHSPRHESNGVHSPARSLIPPPKIPLVRSHGAFAPRSSWRSLVTPRVFPSVELRARHDPFLERLALGPPAMRTDREHTADEHRGSPRYAIRLFRPEHLGAPEESFALSPLVTYVKLPKKACDEALRGIKGRVSVRSALNDAKSGRDGGRGRR
jgi:hypothetical protein